MSVDTPRTGMARYAYRGRHRTPETAGTTVRSAALSAGVVAAVMVGTAAQATAAPGGDSWQRLRICESGGDYRIDTGNGYYGAYQFDLGTWRAYGGTGYPHRATPAEQDHRAKLLYQARGWAPWPACSRKLGLRADPAAGRTAPPPAAHRPTTVSAPAVLARGGTLHLHGTAAPGATVRVLLRYSTEAHYRLVRTVHADRAGDWATGLRPRATAHYYAVAGARRSATGTTRVVVPTTVAGPAVVGLGAAYTIRGTGRPGSRVLVRLAPVGGASWRHAVYRPTDRAGRWSLVWRGSNDYRYYALGETRTAIRTTRIASRAVAAVPAAARFAADRRPVVTVSGSTRPNATVLLYVRTPGRQYRAYRKFAATGSGRYTHRFRAPAGSFQWYARSSNGLYSRIGSVSI